MKVGAYTFKSEDDLDAGEEYSRNGMEVQYSIASGLTAYVNIDDYDYKEGTSDGTTVAHIMILEQLQNLKLKLHSAL